MLISLVFGDTATLLRSALNACAVRGLYESWCTCNDMPEDEQSTPSCGEAARAPAAPGCHVAVTPSSSPFPQTPTSYPRE